MRRSTDQPPSIEDAVQVLQEVWGYASFRPAQQEVLEGIFEGRDVLAILPTGGGKSLLYQVPALLGEGLVVVVSPLIALMQDQVEGLSRRGVKSVAINSTLRHGQVEQALIDARYGKYNILYLAPERLQTELFLSLAPHLDVKLLAVDEAHCVSEWAPTFRPAYRHIPEARALLGDPPVLALTATATPAVRKDMAALLALRNPVSVVQGFDRPNLTFSILHEDNKRARVLQVLGRVAGTAILYASTRRSVEEWHAWLVAQGESAVKYHAGLEAAQRSEALGAWMQDRARVMVATNAFGMGIDKPDVRVVIHAEVPASIEAYYQEAGRGGRDGETAHAVMLWQPRDVETQRKMLASSHPTPAQLAAVFDAVGNLGQVPVGTQPETPLRVHVERVARLAEVTPGLVRSALTILERAEMVTLIPIRGDGYFQWTVSRDALGQQQGEGKLARFIASLVRAIPPEAFREACDVSLGALARKVGLPPDRLGRGLAFLQQRGLAEWQPHEDALLVELRVPRSPRLRVEDQWLDTARRLSDKRLGYVERYLTSSVCRRRYLLGYFGEAAPDHCGRCDVCRLYARNGGPTRDDHAALRRLLTEIKDTSSVRGDIALTPRTAILVNWLVQEDYAVVKDVIAQTYALTPDGERYLGTLSESGE